MTVTVGFAMQISSYAPAVVVQPLSQPMQASYSVEAEKIVEPVALTRTALSRHDFMQQSRGFSQKQEQSMAYTKKGEPVFSAQEFKGGLLDMLA